MRQNLTYIQRDKQTGELNASKSGLRHTSMLTVLLASHVAAVAGAATIQGAPLHNAASPGVAMPIPAARREASRRQGHLYEGGAATTPVPPLLREESVWVAAN